MCLRPVRFVRIASVVWETDRQTDETDHYNSPALKGELN